MTKKSRISWKSILLLAILVIGAVTTILALSFSGYGNQPNPTPSPTPSSSPNPTQNPTSTPNPSLSPSSSVTPTPTQPTPTVTPTQSPEIKIVGKQIPPGYVMGFPVDGGLINGMNVVFLENSGDKFSIRFTAKLSGTVTSLVVYAFAFEGQPSIRVGLQGDNGGNPSGQWMNGSAFGIIPVSNSSGFKTVTLQNNALITNGTVYHIVVEPAENSSGITAMETYQANTLGQPFNPDDPDIVWSDTQMNTLSLSGQAWQPQNKWPIFIVRYSNGKLEGQPYSLLAQWVVWGSTYVGQTLIPASDYKVGKIAFDVSLNSGGSIPQDKLYYQIRNSSDAILSQGVFAESAQLTATQSWVEVSLSTPVTLKAGQLYRIIVLSPLTTLDKAYYLFGHEFSYDQTIGYGGLQHQLTSSLAAGASWGDNPDADAVFKLTTVG